MAGENIADKIENWLREEAFQHNKVPDPRADTNITFWPNSELKMHAIVRRDKLTIIVGSLLSVESRENVIKKSKGEVDEFINSLTFLLGQQEPDFEIMYSDNKTLQGVKIIKNIYSESLTKTSFFDAISSVMHSHYLFGIKQRELSIISG